jgi:hypothetical protein
MRTNNNSSYKITKNGRQLKFFSNHTKYKCGNNTSNNCINKSVFHVWIRLKVFVKINIQYKCFFIHLVVENFTNGRSVFENHAGSEKGYFITTEKEYLSLEKYSDRKAYKDGDKSKIIHIPDLILIDFDREEIINIEGKKYKFKQSGFDELNNYDTVEENYIKKHYSGYKILRTVVLFGSDDENVIEIEVGFLLNSSGKMILGIEAPEIFREAIRNLISFWN